MLVGVVLTSRPVCAQPHGPTTAQVSVCFTPADRCVGSIVAAIGAARSQVRVQAYGFTSAPVLAALKAARGRGVDVAVILDKVNDREEEDADG